VIWTIPRRDPERRLGALGRHVSHCCGVRADCPASAVLNHPSTFRGGGAVPPAHRAPGIVTGHPCRCCGHGRCARDRPGRRASQSLSVTDGSEPRGTSRGSEAREPLGIQSILSRHEDASVQAGRLGRGTVLMVRRRSTVRFRKGALHFQKLKSNELSTASWSKSGDYWPQPAVRRILRSGPFHVA
jgi:hypothetical protein